MSNLLPLALTIVVAIMVAVLIFAVLRFLAAARTAQRRLKDATSETAFLSSTFQDVVGKLKAQEQLMRTRARESEVFSEHIVNSLTAGLLVVDALGLVQMVNPAARRMLPLDDDATARPFREVLARCAPLCDVLVRSLAGEVVDSPCDIALERPAGTRHFSVSVSPLASAAALPAGVVCLVSDVTPVRELEEQLLLKDALARLGELTAGIAHEFRNGLATIHGYSRLLRPEQLPATFQPYVEGIRQESESLGHVMTKFLEYARPDARSFTLVDLGVVARRATADLATELPSGVNVRVEGQLGHILGDEVVLRQVFVNLIRNAVEACQAAGVPAPEVCVRGTMDRRGCRVSVDDNGPGIPESVRARVFEPFFTTRSRGTGLGLAIVQKVVVTHNGRVVAGQAPQGGASIQMTFPLTADVEGSSAA
jgi:signal transduction histidine kinase